MIQTKTSGKPLKQRLTARQKTLPGTLMITAMHEAGHALADYRLSFRIKHVTIDPRKLKPVD